MYLSTYIAYDRDAQVLHVLNDAFLFHWNLRVLDQFREVLLGDTLSNYKEIELLLNYYQMIGK